MKHADYIALNPDAILIAATGIRIKPLPDGGHITQFRSWNPNGGDIIKLPNGSVNRPREYVWLDAEVVSPDSPDIEPLQLGQAS